MINRAIFCSKCHCQLQANLLLQPEPDLKVLLLFYHAEEMLCVRFEPDFLDNMDGLYEELDRLKLDWDLVYLGRKILDNVHEPFVNGSEFLLRPDYTYWTLSYLLSRDEGESCYIFKDK